MSQPILACVHMHTHTPLLKKPSFSVLLFCSSDQDDDELDKKQGYNLKHQLE